jgi:hypothetical protein
LAINRAGAGLAAACLLLFGGLLFLSVNPALGDRMPAFFRNLQFAYRLVSYLNLTLFMTVIGCLLALPPGGAEKPLLRTGNLVLWLTLGLAAFGLVLKLQHGRIRQSAAPQVSGSRALNEPAGFYGGDAYAIAHAAAEPADAPASLQFAVNGGSEFGLLTEIKPTLAAPQTRQLRVQPFPWNDVRVNGQPIDTPDAINGPRGTRVTLAAGENIVSYAWRPDAAWRGLKILSGITLLAWFAFVGILQGRRMTDQVR